MLKRKDQIPDHQLTHRVRQQLSNRGLRAPCEVTVQTFNGVVTLTGIVQYPHQKLTAVRAARGVEGVRDVSDQIQLQPQAKRWD